MLPVPLQQPPPQNQGFPRTSWELWALFRLLRMSMDPPESMLTLHIQFCAHLCPPNTSVESSSVYDPYRDSLGSKAFPRPPCLCELT